MQTPFITIFLYVNEVPPGQTRKDLALIIEEMLHQRIQGVKNESGAWVSPAFPKLIYVLSENNIEEGTEYYYLTELAAKCSAKRLVPDYVSEKQLWQLKYPLDKLLPISKRRDSWGDETIWGANPFKELTDEECAILDSYVQVYRQNEVPSEEVKDILDKYNIPINVVAPKAYCPMGCRSFLTPDYIHYKTYGRLNQGVVTINLPYVALLAKEKSVSQSDTSVIDLFWEELDKVLDLCHLALQTRHKRLKGTLSDGSPIHWQYGALARLQNHEKIDKLLYDNYSTISLGYAGLYECVVALTGKSHTDEAAKPLALDIMYRLNDACASWRKAENISYSLYGTPIESTTEKFALALQRRFGKIKDVSDHGYITNSYHICVREPIGPFDKLKFEAEFQALSPGGAISYIETGHLDNNIPAVMAVIKYIYHTILYAELNTKSDYCQECGYNGDIPSVEENGKFVWKCPQCGNTDKSRMNIARRTCGYIGANYWGQGRTEEIRDRFVHLGGNAFIRDT